MHPHVSRYAQVDVPCRQTIIRCNRVELFLTVTLTRLLFAGTGARVDLLVMRRYGKRYLLYLPICWEKGVEDSRVQGFKCLFYKLYQSFKILNFLGDWRLWNRS
jgi:hypothetical protein